MKLLFLTLFVTYVTAGSQLGGKRCAWGPSYWCSHVDHAKECRAVQHCMTTVWKNQVIQPQSTGECLYCQMGFNELKQVLDNKDIEDDLAKYVADVCELLPNPDLKTICSGIVKEDLPIIIQMLDNKINSDMICATMGMCAGLEDTYSPYGSLDKQENEVAAPNHTCADCTKFFQDLQYMITSNETQSELEQVFNQAVCERIPSLTSICQDAVKELLPVALKFLSDQLDPNIACRVFGFCVSSDHAAVIHIKNIFKDLKQPLKLRSSEECEACKDLVTELDNEIRDKTVQGVIKSDIESYVCVNLGALDGLCKQVVEQYLPLLFELLINEMDPKTVCETVGMCSVPAGYKLVPAVELKPATMIGYKANPVECEICEFAIKELKVLLEKNGTVKDVEVLIDSICKKLPDSTLQKQCADFVQEYVRLVIQDIDKDLDPKVACTMIGVCTAKIEKELLKQNADPECDVCILGVKEVEEILANVSTETVMNYAHELCNFFPGNISATCTTYVNLYLPVFLQLMKSKEDPKSLCRIAGLCSATALQHRPYMTKPIPEDTSLTQSQNSVECNPCKALLAYLKQIVGKNATKAEIETALESLCKMIPAQYADTCDNIVRKYRKTIVEGILKDLNPEAICIEIKLCSQAVGNMLGIQAGILSPVDTLPIVAGLTQSQNGVECNPCKALLAYLKQIVGKNATKAKIETVLESFCKMIPAQYADTCDNIVRKYRKTIVEGILKDLNPEAICIKIKLCSQAVGNMLGIQAGILSPVDTLPIVADEEPNQSSNDNKVDVSFTCEVCDTALYFLKLALGNNATEAEIRSELEGLCNYLPAAYRDECEEIVATYSDQIVHLVLQNLNPNEICTEIGLCSSVLDAALKIKAGILSPVDTLPIVGDEEPKEVRGSVDCEACMFILNAADKALQMEATQEAIKGAMLDACELIPGGLQSECKSLVTDEYKVIINYLLLSESPASICKTLQFCPAAPAMSKVSQKVGVSGPECLICEFVIKELDSLLKQNASEAEIKAALEKVCTILPDTISKECEGFVSKYAPVIIDLLINEVKPDQICKTLKLCTSVSMAALSTPVKILHTKEFADLCGVCKGVVTALKNFLSENRTEKEIEQFLDNLCDILPDTVTAQHGGDVVYVEKQRVALEECCAEYWFEKAKRHGLVILCEDVVQSYIPAIVDLIEQDLTPAQICQQIGLCSKTADFKPMKGQHPFQKPAVKTDTKLYFQSKANLLGGKKCTYGPAYWCASMENAKRCGALAHCQNHVWN